MNIETPKPVVSAEWLAAQWRAYERELRLLLPCPQNILNFPLDKRAGINYLKNIGGIDMKNTPGPWSRNIKPAKKYNTIFAGRNTHICHLAVIGLRDEEVEDNCNLIMAAPEMYAALKQFLQLDWSKPQDAVGFNQQMAKQASLAIARAEGQ
jgi:hypothetical protein